MKVGVVGVGRVRGILLIPLSKMKGCYIFLVQILYALFLCAGYSIDKALTRDICNRYVFVSLFC